MGSETTDVAHPIRIEIRDCPFYNISWFSCSSCGTYCEAVHAL